MLLRGIAGTKRLVRHLWRMCFGLFIATGSFFLGQQQVFPRAVRGSALLLILGIFPLFVLLFWFIRVRFTRYASRLYARASPLFSGQVRTKMATRQVPRLQRSYQLVLEDFIPWCVANSW